MVDTRVWFHSVAPASRYRTVYPRAPNTGFQVTATPLATACATTPVTPEIGRCGIVSGMAGTDWPMP
ncbi:hypothetical protein ACWEO4_10520 [Streptomyces sp. NPDC004393]|uniref:hypothetical protein n=1 Tax=Streptomyces sp. NPDC004533 TaxID=3154278 RepID=UPI0033B853B3